MVLFRTLMHLKPEARERVMRSLIGTLEPIRALPGCAECSLMVDAEDEKLVRTEERWTNHEWLRARIRGDLMPILLAALDCSTEPPEVRIDTISESKGMELIAAYRGATL